MNLLIEITLRQGFLLDLLGVLGLCLVAIAALRLARRMPGLGARLMTWGALALIAGRVGMLFLIQSAPPLDPDFMAIARTASLVLLTAGLGVLVWGFWSHEQALADDKGAA